MSVADKTPARVRGKVRSWQGRYGLAILATLIALGARVALTPLLDGSFPFTTFYVAVTLTAWFLGFGPSLVTMVLGYLVADWFFLEPLHTIGPHLDSPMPLIIYFSGSSTICIFAKSMHDAQRRAAERQALLQAEIAERNRVELELLKAQQQLRRHADDLEQRVAERTAKLQETVDSLEGVCYSIAHDLRAPIRAMQGYATALQEEFPEIGKNYTQRIKTASVRMDQLVQDLLAYGRLSRHEMQPAIVDIERELDWVMKSMGEEILQCGAVLNVQRPLPRIIGNETILRQVLTNLLGNALKFTKTGVVPTIRVYAQNGDRLRLFVEDNGIGIEARYYERIFKVFERLHGVEAYPGTGIGLAIVKKGVEKMGGQVGVQSEPGKGSSFWMEFIPADAKTLPGGVA